jgi:hypothetical protein
MDTIAIISFTRFTASEDFSRSDEAAQRKAGAAPLRE